MRLHEHARVRRVLDLRRTGDPAVSPIDLDLARLHLSVDTKDFDVLIQEKIDTAVESLDGYAGSLGKCLVDQEWTWGLDRLPAYGPIKIPLAPLIAVVSITYVDQTGVTQTLSPSAYSVIDGPVGEIWPAFGTSWPQARCFARSVLVVFRAGYAAAPEDGEPDPQDVPKPIRDAILLMVGDLLTNREGALIDSSRGSVVGNPAVDNLLAKYRLIEP